MSCDPCIGTKREVVLAGKHIPKLSALFQTSERCCLMSDSDFHGGVAFAVG